MPGELPPFTDEDDSRPRTDPGLVPVSGLPPHYPRSPKVGRTPNTGWRLAMRSAFRTAARVLPARHEARRRRADATEAATEAAADAEWANDDIAMTEAAD